MRRRKCSFARKRYSGSRSLPMSFTNSLSIKSISSSYYFVHSDADQKYRVRVSGTDDIDYAICGKNIC